MNDMNKRIPDKTTVTFLLNIPAGGGWGGCEERLIERLSFVDYDAHRVILMVNHNLLFPEKIRNFGIPVEIMNFPFSLEDTRFWPRILKMCRFLSSVGTRRVIFVHNMFLQFGLADFLAGFLVSRGHVYSWEVLLAPRPLQRGEVKSSVRFGIFRGLGLWWYKEMVPIILRGWLSRGIVAISRDVKKRMVKEYFYPENRVHVVTNGTEPRKYCPDPETRAKMRGQLGFADEDVIILGVGRLCKQKRFERAITVFDELCAVDPRVRLILIGDGGLRGELETLAASLKNSSRVHFLGFQPDPARYYMMSDIFVLPSESEGFSGAMLEALSSGLISVFTDVSGVRDVIEDGVNGFVVPQTREGVREGLIRAISLSPEERLKMAAAARQDIIKYFNKESLIPKALNILGVRSKP